MYVCMYVCVYVRHTLECNYFSYWYTIRMRISFKIVTTLTISLLRTWYVHVHFGYAKMASSAQATSPSEGCRRAAARKRKQRDSVKEEVKRMKRAEDL